MEELFYWYKPYILYTLGFICGGLDHPIKWVSVVLFLLISFYISFARFQNKQAEYHKVTLQGGIRAK